MTAHKQKQRRRLRLRITLKAPRPIVIDAAVITYLEERHREIARDLAHKQLREIAQQLLDKLAEEIERQFDYLEDEITELSACCLPGASYRGAAVSDILHQIDAALADAGARIIQPVAAAVPGCADLAPQDAPHFRSMEEERRAARPNGGERA
jgi:hypothetical protein